MSSNPCEANIHANDRFGIGLKFNQFLSDLEETPIKNKTERCS